MGVPPLVGVAVNVTLVPAHIEPTGLCAMFTLAVPPVFTINVILFDVAGEPVTQDAFEVIIHVITFPFASVDEV